MKTRRAKKFLFICCCIALVIYYRLRVDSLRIHNFSNSYDNQHHTIQILPIEIFNGIIDSNNIIDVINFIHLVGIKLSKNIFLIDPAILFKLLTKQEQEILYNNKFLTENISSQSHIEVDGITHPLITFGIILNRDSNGSLLNICDKMIASNNIECIEYRAFKFRGYSDLSKIKDDEEVLTNILINLNNTFISLQIFHRINSSTNVLWTAKNNDYNTEEQVEEIYEDIKIAPKNFISDYGETVIKLNLPSDIFELVSQLQSSTLIHCNKSSAAKLLAGRNEDKQEYARKSLIDMKSLGKKLNFPFFLSFGSHLGWYRECSANSYTTDADYATWEAQFSNQKFLDKIIARTVRYSEDQLRMLYIFGNFTHGFELSFQSNNNFKSDLFFMKLNYSSKQSYMSSHDTSTHVYFYYYYPLMDKLCSAYFLDRKVNVPCNPLDLIIPEYGDNWMHPIDSQDWSYITSSHNRGPLIKWDERFVQVQIFNSYDSIFQLLG